MSKDLRGAVKRTFCLSSELCPVELVELGRSDMTRLQEAEEI